MKTTFNKKFFSLLAIVVFSGFSLASAQEIKTRELAFSFPFFNLFESEAENEVEENSRLAIAYSEKETRNSCEIYDSITNNLLTLETASANAKEKIENVEETIDKESSVRDSIFYSVKNLLGLQKTDKVIFREMRKDIDDAKIYYGNLDTKVVDTNNFLSDNPCEKTKAQEAGKVDSETSDLVQDEATFRKQFAASLKEKLKILQDGVKEAKK